MRSTSSDLRGRRLLLGLLASVVLLAGACGNSDDGGAASADDDTTTTVDTGGAATSISGVPGVTDDEIRFAAFGTITQNPLGTCVLECYVQGIEAYFDYRNSEGGIDGRKLVLGDVLDDQLSKNQEKALEIVSKNDSFGAFSAAQLGTGWGDIATTGMPLYVWNISPQDAAHPEIFGNPQSTICLECPRQVNGHIIKEAKADKIGILGYGASENSKLASQATKEAVELYSEEIGGAEVAYFNDNIPFGVPNGVGPEVTRMKDEGVDLIFGSLDLNAMKTLAQELERQGMGDVPMVHANTYDHDFVKEAGELFEGDIVTLAIRPFEAETGDSDLDLFKEWMGKTGHEPVELALYGWIAARTAYDGIVAAGPEFDRAKVVAASNEQFSAYTAGGLLPPQDYTKPHEVPTAATLGEFGPEYSCMAMVTVKSGEFEVVGDAAKPFFCWPGNTVDWSEPEAMDAK